MKRFSPDQLIVVLLVAAVILGLLFKRLFFGL
jgi:Sec-independent protein translocase protein TatA